MITTVDPFYTEDEILAVLDLLAELADTEVYSPITAAYLVHQLRSADPARVERAMAIIDVDYDRAYGMGLV